MNCKVFVIFKSIICTFIESIVVDGGDEVLLVVDDDDATTKADDDDDDEEEDDDVDADVNEETEFIMPLADTTWFDKFDAGRADLFSSLLLFLSVIELSILFLYVKYK